MSDGVSDGFRESESEEEIEQTPQIVYGISLFMLDNGQPSVNVTGEPDMGALQRLMAGALQNLNADIIARKVLDKMEAEKSKSKITKLGGGAYNLGSR